VKYCQGHIPFGGEAHLGHDDYIRFYLSQIAYNLGEDRYADLFPDSRLEERWMWSKFRKPTFDHLKRTQTANGSWSGIFSTAANLIVLQLDKASLPFFQR